MDLDPATEVNVMKPVTLTELFQVFGTYISQAVMPLGEDLREFRTAMAIQLGHLRDEVATQTVEFAGLRIAFDLKQADIEARVKSLEKDRDSHNDILKEVGSVMAVLKWIGLGLGGSILALIWGMLIGRVQVTFR